MFEDSLFESGGRAKTARGWSTLISFLLQVGLVIVMVMIPLLFTQALPKTQLMELLVAPVPPPPPPPMGRVAVRTVRIEVSDGRLHIPDHIPRNIVTSGEEAAPPEIGSPNGVPGGVPSGTPNGVISSILGNTSTASIPRIAVQAPRLVRVSAGVSQGMLIQRVEPLYPPLARQAGVSGSVILQAEISEDGAIQNLRLISGHPMLAPAAIEAVKRWRYRPYILNNEPVEVETTITVNFTLAGG